MHNVEVLPRSRKDIRHVAMKFRKLLGMEDIPYIDVIWLVEQVMYSMIDGYNFEILSNEEMGDNHGLTKGRIIQIREDVYERAVRQEGRDRFTIAHELGHLILHSDQQCSFARGKVVKYKDPEWQADAFAGEFLMPDYLIKNKSIEEVAKKFKVSYAAAECQLNITKKKKGIAVPFS